MPYLRIELTPEQVHAVLAVIAPVVGDSKGALEEAERELDGALLEYEQSEVQDRIQAER